VPYPHAAADHQQANARFYAEAGGALVVDEQADPLRCVSLLESALVSLVTDTRRRESMRTAMRSVARPDAAAEVAGLLQSLVTARMT
jgi:UDP-N-acetylglucosamine--N-acetylmuramyl-(pentapeptide) pyrophosphoryl-undecaprenol N-acetylglucosamine transferase